jgi:hypothetical protein
VRVTHRQHVCATRCVGRASNIQKMTRG